jgi:hypothetical protein
MVRVAPEAWAESNELYSVQNMKLTDKASGKDRALKDLFKAYPYFTQTKWYDRVRNDGTHLIRFMGILDTSEVGEQLEKFFGQLVNEVHWVLEYPFSQKLDPQNVMSALAALEVSPKSYYIVVLKDGHKKRKNSNAKGELFRIFHDRPISFYEGFQTKKPAPLPEGELGMEMPMK